MRNQAAASRRGATRTKATDENAFPSQAMRNKTSMSHLGPAQKTTQPVKKPVAVKVGAKRTALGGVVNNGQQEDMDEKKRKFCCYL